MILVLNYCDDFSYWIVCVYLYESSTSRGVASKLTDSHLLPSSQLLSIAYFVDNLLVSVLLPPVMGSSPPESAANMFWRALTAYLKSPVLVDYWAGI